MPTATELGLREGEIVNISKLHQVRYQYRGADGEKHEGTESGRFELGKGPRVKVLEIDFVEQRCFRGTKVRFLEGPQRGMVTTIHQGYNGYVRVEEKSD